MNIKAIIKIGENETIEFKLDKIRNEHLSKELGALANFRGGSLLLGVSDKGKIVGLTRNDNEERLQNIAYNFEPPIPLQVEKISVDGTLLLNVKIHDISGKPYVYKSSTRNIYYTRSGSVSREATRAEVRRMFQDSAELHFEISKISGASVNDLDFFLINSFLTDYRNIFLESLDKNEQAALLENLSLTAKNNKATVLGIVLFGKNPSQFLPGCQVQVAVYSGNDNTSKVHDHRVFSRALIADFPLILSYLENYNPHSFDESKGQRQESVKYPDFAVREAVVNALCHRDFTMQGQSVKIEIFPDRMIVTSPGGLPNTQTIDRIKTGISYARNPLLLQYFYDYRYVERLGRGVPKIIAAMEANGNAAPEFIDGGAYFQLVLNGLNTLLSHPKSAS